MGILSMLFGSIKNRGFSDKYAGGILTIDSPTRVRVYEAGSTMRYEMLYIREAVTVTDTRWSGSRIIITMDDPRWPRPRVRSYYDFGAFEELRA